MLLCQRPSLPVHPYSGKICAVGRRLLPELAHLQDDCLRREVRAEWRMSQAPRARGLIPDRKGERPGPVQGWEDRGDTLTVINEDRRPHLPLH
jgi:hypothetical protein